MHQKRTIRAISGRTAQLDQLCDARSVQSRYIFFVGGSLVLVGLVLIPLPGPGLLIVSLGLLVLVAGLVVFAASWLSHRRGSPATR